jgi:spermidine/putrescine transport system substrate-binding protein
MTDELAKLDPEVADNPLINPSEETFALLHSWPALTDEQDAEYATIYAEVTGE